MPAPRPDPPPVTLAVELLAVEGSHAEMGRAQGEKLRGALHDWVFALGRDAQWSGRAPAFVPRAAAAWFLRRRARGSIGADVDRLLSRQAERVAGLAAGAGLDRSWLDLAQGAGLLSERARNLVAASSTLAVGRGRAPGGSPMLARNLDGAPGWASGLLVRISRPKTRLASLEVSGVAQAGCLLGVNERGLALSGHPMRAGERCTDHLPLALLVQEALEQCATTAEALQLVLGSPRGEAGSIVALDAAGDARALELTPGFSGVREARRGLLIATDHFASDDMLGRGPGHAERFLGEAGGAGGARILESSEVRWERAAQLLEGLAVIEEARLAAVLADHSGASTGGENTLCRHGPRARTACSAIVFPSRREARIGLGPACLTERIFYHL